MDCTVRKKIADWSVQKAKTVAARRGDKSRLLSDSRPLFDQGRGGGGGKAFKRPGITYPLPPTMQRLAKLLRTHTEQRK